MYGEFAKWYDKMMLSVDYDSWSSYLDTFLKENKCRSVLECGCGTGNITVRLAKKGYDTIASDISEDMLMQTRTKMLKSGLRFPVIQQDMCSLSVHRCVDAVVSACDGVNYLTENPENFFSAAYRALRPGGILLFDISSKYKLSHILNNSSFCETGEDWAYICDCEYEEKSELLHMYLTCFTKENTLYRRFEEHHIQHAFSCENILKILRNIGFDPISCYRCFSRELPSDNDERIQFAAIRPF